MITITCVQYASLAATWSCLHLQYIQLYTFKVWSYPFAAINALTRLARIVQRQNQISLKNVMQLALSFQESVNHIQLEPQQRSASFVNRQRRGKLLQNPVSKYQGLLLDLKDAFRSSVDVASLDFKFTWMLEVSVPNILISLNKRVDMFLGNLLNVINWIIMVLNKIFGLGC